MPQPVYILVLKKMQLYYMQSKTTDIAIKIPSAKCVTNSRYLLDTFLALYVLLGYILDHSLKHVIELS